jgi:tRNA A-37 threonylcarbamoyl transferase component Bud32
MLREDEIVDTLRAGGFLQPGAPPPLERLAGGVSSDVFRLETPAGVYCVKRALAILRVAAEWRAPVERSHYEVEWLRTARTFVGDRVPQVLFEDPSRNTFVMEFFDPETHSVWKQDLARGHVDVEVARQVGALIGKVHSGTAGDFDVARRFPTGDLFEDLRLAPYLRHAARAHPDLAPRLLALADRTATMAIALVHGDVSPKNILCGPGGPILLDAECAWYGDPAFDLAFCSTHLLLKTVWRPAYATAFLDAASALHKAYLAALDWEPAAQLEARAAALTGGLLLARVDGKSPVEYLVADGDRAFVRHAARRLIESPASTMAELTVRWRELQEAR